MNCLVIGGTRFFGIHLIKSLLENGHEVTIATRGKHPDPFGDFVQRVAVDRTDMQQMKKTFENRYFDAVIDDLAYCALDVKCSLDHIQCGRYVIASSAVIYELHPNTTEDDFLPLEKELVWSGRTDYPYKENKMYAECALFQAYAQQNAAAARFPFVLGKDDYTKRLTYYVANQIKEIPMHADNIDSQMSFIRSDEAGKFLAFLVESDYRGPINACSAGSISIREIGEYVKSKTGKSPIYGNDGEDAPYNDTPSYNINTEKAEAIGFRFTPLKEWIYELIDYEIAQIR
ncbi:MAG: NAD-dependent epimerase/dehydratase family protein [Anaerofustis sp.]